MAAESIRLELEAANRRVAELEAALRVLQNAALAAHEVLRYMPRGNSVREKSINAAMSVLSDAAWATMRTSGRTDLWEKESGL